MEYTKQTWTAPTGTGLSRYAKSGETDTHIELALDPVNLTNTPTPFTMARMAHMEEGIAKAYDTAPPTPWAQYSGKDIPQLPDNVAGTTYKRDNDWVDTDGWTTNYPSTKLSVEDETLKAVYVGAITDTGLSISKTLDATGMFIKGHIKCTVPIISVSYWTGSTSVYFILTNPNTYETAFYGYIPTAHTSLFLYVNRSQLTDKTCWLSQIYIGTGAYDRLVFDNSYHYRHLLNNAVVPTPQGLYFNGTTSYLRSKEPVTLPDVFTFSATVNCAIKNTSQVFILHGNPGTANNRVYVYRDTSSNNLFIKCSNTSITEVTFFTGVNYFLGLDNTDIDVKVEINFINQTIKVYRDGVQFGTTISAPSMVKPVATNLYIGNSNTLGSPLLGYMRNIQLFDTALTDTQRNWLAQGNTPPILYDVTNYKLGNADTASKANVRVSLRHGNTWFDKTWTDLTDLPGEHFWTDGDNIYYSYDSTQLVLNKTTSTWVVKTWTGLTNFEGRYIWTAGENIYYSSTTNHYVLNKATSTWSLKTWTGLTSFTGNNIWTDGENIYYSDSTNQFVLNKATSTWVTKIWAGLTNFNGAYIWTDGENIYYSNGASQLVLNKTTNTWVVKTWTGIPEFAGRNIWTDGDNIYYSSGTTQLVLNKTTNTWVVKTWTGIPEFAGRNIWTDGDNIYYSAITYQYVLPATRHNYVDDDKYNSLFGKTIRCNCSTLSDRFVFRNE